MAQPNAPFSMILLALNLASKTINKKVLKDLYKLRNGEQIASRFCLHKYKSTFQM